MEKNRRRIPTIPHLHPRSPMYMHAETRRPPPDIPVLTTIPARPHPGTHAAVKAIGYVPGSPVHTDIRMAASGRLAPPPPGPMHALVCGRVCVRGCGSALG